MTSIDEIVRELNGLMEKAELPWVEYGKGWSGSWLVGPDKDKTSVGVIPAKHAVAACAKDAAPIIAKCVSAIPSLLSALARSRRMEEALRSISRYAVRGDDIHFDGIVESARAALEDT